MDGDDPWSDAAAGWARHWGRFSDPAREAVLEAARLEPGAAALDIGCGSGEFLAMLARHGIRAAGLDPAPEMLALARSAAPGAELREGSADALPWADASFDLVTAFNALHFADDVDDALAEAARVTRAGGFVAVANWAEGARNDLDTVERAVADAVGEPFPPDGELRLPGGLEGLLADAGLTGIRSLVVPVPWTADDDEALVAGILLGEDAAVLAELGPVVVRAAAPFRLPGGGYRLANAFRVAIGQVPADFRSAARAGILVQPPVV